MAPVGAAPAVGAIGAAETAGAGAAAGATGSGAGGRVEGWGGRAPAVGATGAGCTADTAGAGAVGAAGIAGAGGVAFCAFRANGTTKRKKKRNASKAIADPDQMQLVPLDKVIVSSLSNGILCHARRKIPPYAKFCQGAGSGVGSFA